MQIRYIAFTEPNQVSCKTAEKTLAAPPNGALVQMRYTCISAGTELAKLSGLQPVEFPLGPLGNRAVGRVLEVGAERDDLKPGDLVFCHGTHSSCAAVDRLLVKLPDQLDRPETALLGMALVAFTGLRVGQPELGDTAVVTGAGLVGQFAAQLLQLAGVKVILVDPVPGRLDIARHCGIDHGISAEGATEKVLELTAGQGAEYIFECSGIPAVVEGAVAYGGRSAQLILIGSPRGEFRADLTDFLNHFHLWRPQGDLTLKGAHEWKIPLYPVHGSKHSMARNGRILAELLVAEKLKMAPLLTGVFNPEDGQEAYTQLRLQKEQHLGAVFAWTGSK